MEEKKKIKSIINDIIKGIKFGLILGLTVGFIIGIVKGVSLVSSNAYFQNSLHNLALATIQLSLNSAVSVSVILAIAAIISLMMIKIYRESGLVLISSFMILLYIASFRRISPFSYLSFILMLYGVFYPIGISTKLREKFSFLNKVANGKLVLVPIILILICNGFIYSYRLNTRPKGPNIILISIDALRADHLSCYGYHRNTSPNIDQLASQGVLFKNGFSQACSTVVSHSSIFLSQYPWTHKITGSEKKIGKSSVTLTEILKNWNYITAGFVGGAFMSSIYGFGQGFDFFFDRINTSRTIKFHKDNIFRWLEKVKDKKFFLFLHTYDVHSPYDPPMPYRTLYIGNYSDQRALSTLGDYKLTALNLSPEEIDYLIALYDAGINYVDDEIGELVKRLKKLNIFNNSVIIITADHGERLGERGRVGHGGEASRIVTHVPLIMRVPGICQGKVVEEIVESIDITPTILDILDISLPEWMQGKSILPLIEGSEIEGNFIACTSEEWGNAPFSRAIRTEEWTYIMNRREPDELYDRINDPKEQSNIIKKRPLIAQELKKQLEDFIALTSEGKPQATEEVHIDKELKERLESLGYLH
ncbi:MAG TPA: sulfatase [bacterium]|nr:sulfatase [bacterium]